MDASIWIGIGLIIVAILFMYIPKLPKKAPENYDDLIHQHLANMREAHIKRLQKPLNKELGNISSNS